MTPDNFLSLPLATAVGLTILHSLWEGAAVALTLLAVLSVTRSAVARYVFACAAMMIIAVGFVLTFIHFAPSGSGGRSSGLYVHTLGSALGSLPVGPTAFRLGDALPWLAPLWMLGVAGFHLYGFMGWVAARRLRRMGVWSASEQWRLRVDELRAKIGVARPVQVLESCLARVPLVMGIMRPVILIPAGMFAGLSQGQVETILLHELAHIRRHDYLVNLIATALEGFLFYHPAAWWIARVIHTERENCCDDFVVGLTGNSLEYASALTALEEQRSQGTMALAASGGSLINRIARIMNGGRPSHTLLTPLVSAGVLAVCAAAAATAWQAATLLPAGTPWEKWVREDVAYITTDQVKQAFESLTTDQERENFVEQFWLQRDPTPGTPQNEFKEEHYRRIAFVNAHFGGPVPGWKSDRGRAYIMFGPPDEIDSHATGSSGSPFASEEWHYLFIEGRGRDVVMEFVDRKGNGAYVMTSDPSQKR